MPTRREKESLRRELSLLTPKEWEEFSDEEVGVIERYLNSPDEPDYGTFPTVETRREGMAPDLSRYPTRREDWRIPENFGSAILRNPPQSLLETGRELGRFLGLMPGPQGEESHLLENLGTLGLGAARGAQLLLAPGTARRSPAAGGALARGQEVLETVPRALAWQMTPTEAARHPVGALSTAAAVAAPVMPAGALRTLAGLASDVPQAAVGGLVRAGRLGASTLGKTGAGRMAGEIPGMVASESLGFMTGLGGKGIREVAGASRASEAAAQEALTALRGGKALEDIGGDVYQAIKAEIDALGAAKGNILAPAGNIPTGQMKFDIFGNVGKGGAGGVLEQLGVELQAIAGPSRKGKNEFLYRFPGGTPTSTWLKVRFSARIPKKDQPKILEALADVGALEELTPAIELDGLKMALDDLRVSKKSGRIISTMRQPIRDKLSTIPGYDKAAQDYKAFLDQVEEASGRLGADLRLQGLDITRPKEIAKARVRIGERLRSAYSEDIPSIESRERALDTVAKLTKQPNLPVTVAAQRFARRTPTNLVGRGQFAAAIPTMFRMLGGGTATYFATGSLPVAIGSLAFYSPRVAMWAAIQSGRSARWAQGFQKQVNSALTRARAQGISTETLTIGELFERLGITGEDLQGLED